VGCGGCGHKYFRPPRPRPVGAVAGSNSVVQPRAVQQWRYVPRPVNIQPAQPVVPAKPKEG
jgi:hypothetical protein